MIFIGVGVHNLVKTKHTIQLKTIEIQDINLQLKNLEEKYQQELHKNNVNQEELQKLQQERERLEKELQARAEAKRIAAERLQKASNTATFTATASAASCGDNEYKAYIYMKESGCRTDAINRSSGACGIGQALPCSKLPCSLSDFACQDAWFTNYAITRYGSWYNAYVFWTRNSWW